MLTRGPNELTMQSVSYFFVCISENEKCVNFCYDVVLLHFIFGSPWVLVWLSQSLHADTHRYTHMQVNRCIEHCIGKWLMCRTYRPSEGEGENINTLQENEKKGSLAGGRSAEHGPSVNGEI